MRQHQVELEQLQLQVAAVTFEKLALAEAYLEETGLPWPMLVDESRSLYQAYGVDRASFWTVAGPQNWGTYISLMARGRRPRRPNDDIYQLGADVLIDGDGMVRLHRVERNSSDRPSVESLLEAVRDAD